MNHSAAARRAAPTTGCATACSRASCAAARAGPLARWRGSGSRRTGPCPTASCTCTRGSRPPTHSRTPSPTRPRAVSGRRSRRRAGRLQPHHHRRPRLLGRGHPTVRVLRAPARSGALCVPRLCHQPVHPCPLDERGRVAVQVGRAAALLSTAGLPVKRRCSARCGGRARLALRRLAVGQLRLHELRGEGGLAARLRERDAGRFGGG